MSHAPFRDPTEVTVEIQYHPHALETSVRISEHTAGLETVIFDDWSKVPDRELADWLCAVLKILRADGPLSAHRWADAFTRRPGASWPR